MKWLPSEITNIDIEKVNNISRLPVQMLVKLVMAEQDNYLIFHLRKVDRRNMLELLLHNICKSHDDSSIDSVDDTGAPSKEIIGIIVREGQ